MIGNINTVIVSDLSPAGLLWRNFVAPEGLNADADSGTDSTSGGSTEYLSFSEECSSDSSVDSFTRRRNNALKRRDPKGEQKVDGKGVREQISPEGEAEADSMFQSGKAESYDSDVDGLAVSGDDSSSCSSAGSSRDSPPRRSSFRSRVWTDSPSRVERVATGRSKSTKRTTNVNLAKNTTRDSWSENRETFRATPSRRGRERKGDMVRFEVKSVDDEPLSMVFRVNDAQVVNLKRFINELKGFVAWAKYASKSPARSEAEILQGPPVVPSSGDFLGLNVEVTDVRVIIPRTSYCSEALTAVVQHVRLVNHLLDDPDSNKVPFESFKIDLTELDLR